MIPFFLILAFFSGCAFGALFIICLARLEQAEEEMKTNPDLSEITWSQIMNEVEEAH